MTNNVTEETNFQDGYRVIKKSDGFYIRWYLSDDEKKILNTFFDNLSGNKANVESIDCHMKIWNKIFYTKHRTATWNKRHSEDTVLKSINLKILSIINKAEECVSIAQDTNGEIIKWRYILKEIYFIKEKKIVYKYVVNISKKRIKIISIHRNK